MDKNDYLKLIPSNLAAKPKYRAFVEALLDVGDTAFSCTDSMNIAFAVQTAEGVQLDTIGELVGVKRLIPFSFIDGSSRLLSDDEYRLMIQLKIAKNVWKGTNKDIVDIYKSVFNDVVTVEFADGQDMHVEYAVYGALTTRDTIILGATGNLLVPAGVDCVLYSVGGESVAPGNLLCKACGEEMYEDGGIASMESIAV